MTNREAAEEIQKAIDLIRQDGKDWLDERDIPILEMAINALTKEAWKEEHPVSPLLQKLATNLQPSKQLSNDSPELDKENGELISRQAVRNKLIALVNEFEKILSNIREKEVDDSVCGLCEYDGAYIGQSGDWCNECPGFEKDDCFKLKEKYREEWMKIDG